MSKNRDILDQERKHFVQGCLRNGYDETSAEKIYDLIVRFANYGFNRSHAVAQYDWISACLFESELYAGIYDGIIIKRNWK